MGSTSAGSAACSGAGAVSVVLQVSPGFTRWGALLRVSTHRRTVRTWGSVLLSSVAQVPEPSTQLATVVGRVLPALATPYWARNATTSRITTADASCNGHSTSN